MQVRLTVGDQLHNKQTFQLPLPSLFLYSPLSLALIVSVFHAHKKTSFVSKPIFSTCTPPSIIVIFLRGHPHFAHLLRTFCGPQWRLASLDCTLTRFPSSVMCDGCSLFHFSTSSLSHHTHTLAHTIGHQILSNITPSHKERERGRTQHKNS